jgi:hypothetical protein
MCNEDIEETLAIGLADRDSDLCFMIEDQFERRQHYRLMACNLSEHY